MSFQLIPAYLLLAAYTIGRFPMGLEYHDTRFHWVEPRKRGILPLTDIHLPRRLRRRIRHGGFSAALDGDFAAVIENCGGRTATWINSTIIGSYTALHRAGLAHSVEVYASGQLAGGLYGVALGGAFFGESMYSSVPMASQIALVHLVDQLRKTGFQLLDIQFISPHLKRFGAREIPAETFQLMLRGALQQNCRLKSQPFESDSVSALQRISQIS